MGRPGASGVVVTLPSDGVKRRRRRNIAVADPNDPGLLILDAVSRRGVGAGLIYAGDISRYYAFIIHACMTA